MVKQNQIGKAPSLAPEVLEKIAMTLRPISKTPVTTRNLRAPLFIMESPARGRFTALGIRLVGDLAVSWGLESRFPQALQANDSDVPGYVVFTPVALYDSQVEDQYEISWYEGFRRATMDLRPIMQPRNLEVPEGFVSEIPVSVEQLPDGKSYLFLHVGALNVRPKSEADAEDDEAAPTGEVAPGKE